MSLKEVLGMNVLEQNPNQDIQILEENNGTLWMLAGNKLYPIKAVA